MPHTPAPKPSAKPMAPLDPRTHAYRLDVAADYLVGKVPAQRFVTGTLYQVVASVVPIYKTPASDAERTSELLHGEEFIVYDSDGDWAWGQSRRDRYVGYVLLHHLSATPAAPSHTIITPKTFVYSDADVKAPVLGFLTLNARVKATEEKNGYARLRHGGWVPVSHLRPLKKRVPFTAKDFVAIALQFQYGAYLWGGRTAEGMDCSGLIQAALHALGKDCPRDADMQQATLGKEIALGKARAGDLVFFRRHVGIVLDKKMFLHATSHSMRVCIEPLATVVRRYKKQGSFVVAKRLW